MDAVETSVPEGLSVARDEVTADELKALGVDLERDFPGSSAADFRRYPVLSEGGWFTVVKHQKTLRSVSRERGPLLGPIVLTSDGLDVD
ncbi:hypothetical protein [Amycolatopsis jiangsuensis]|uniref:Uncharacterized protein n=1 Tax=Amycolatopsis jiangsuensis TaxID=1181879 RepID=A0A840J2F6_9PSEU|nr:hypothetical protein [Amycolatopsis jiangsuensis]MBB4689206.1 hypothetical protein [Amycolatopsis jiangsuensis]